MQAGPRFSTDPTAFAKALQLDHTIQQVQIFRCAHEQPFETMQSGHAGTPFDDCKSQTAPCDVNFAPLTRSDPFVQDGQEFFKLLLSLLEAQLARSSQQVCLPASHALVALPQPRWAAQSQSL